MIKKTGQSS